MSTESINPARETSRRLQLSVSNVWPGRLIKLAIVLAIASGLGFYFLDPDEDADSETENSDLLIHTVQRGDFEAFVTESGDIESSNNVEVKCEVKSEGSAGTTILDIVEEGTNIKEGEFLIQFDDSALQQTLTQQQILVATDDKVVIESRNELNKAKQTLDEYKDGLFIVDKETFESELLQAESQLKTAQDSYIHAQRMMRKGYVSKLQLEAQQVAVEMATKNVKVAETKLKVHTQFTFKRMVSEYQAEIDKQQAALKAAEFTLKLSQQRRDEIKAQIARCRVFAPAAGQVVYANDFEKRNNIVIEEGAQIREGQVVIRLPNPNEMQIKTRINDSKIKQVKVDNPVTVELDVNPDLNVTGIVAKVNPFPYPRQWYGGPIEYGAEIRIENPPAALTPGQRAKVKIFVEKKTDVLQVPIQAVIEKSGTHFCLVRTQEGNWNSKKVSIGSNDGSFVVIDQGVDEGDDVALNPDILWDDVMKSAGKKSDDTAPAKLASK